MLNFTSSSRMRVMNHNWSATKYRLHRQSVAEMVKGKGKGLDTCYSATYMSQTRDQQRFTITEVAADWDEPVVPQRIMCPSIARPNGQFDPQVSHHAVLSEDYRIRQCETSSG